ncbi:unnamed protein product [Protopolystoma xenopodis]|uniref:LRRNT domain-containing protein n=1 Tax=Protopolystoma xenopodis TaxID=117903 RepID=A0A448WIQ0_9PLAT|nr:unnamed protein product [Protopolystoma xenopodis]
MRPGLKRLSTLLSLVFGILLGAEAGRAGEKTNRQVYAFLPSSAVDRVFSTSFGNGSRPSVLGQTRLWQRDESTSGLDHLDPNKLVLRGGGMTHLSGMNLSQVAASQPARSLWRRAPLSVSSADAIPTVEVEDGNATLSGGEAKNCPARCVCRQKEVECRQSNLIEVPDNLALDTEKL